MKQVIDIATVTTPKQLQDYLSNYLKRDVEILERSTADEKLLLIINVRQSFFQVLMMLGRRRKWNEKKTIVLYLCRAIKILSDVERVDLIVNFTVCG